MDGTTPQAPAIAEVSKDPYPVSFELLCEDDRHRQDAPTRISVSPHGKLVSVVREDGHVTPGGSERYGLNWSEFDVLMGRLLTLCDATFNDPVQRKAFKDMVRQHVKEWVANCATDAAWDAGLQQQVSAPFVGGVFDQAGGLFGVEGEPTP